MAVINKSRVIRPSTHAANDPYRVHCDDVGLENILQITITHESDTSVNLLFEISGRGLNGKNSIHFLPDKTSSGWQINWLGGVQPNQIR